MFSMEGMVMSVRKLLLGAIAMSITTLAAAEPAKPEAAAQAANRPAEVVLASAEQIGVPVPTVQNPSAAAETPAAAPAKKRAARVTTCRCADQTAQR